MEAVKLSQCGWQSLPAPAAAAGVSSRALSAGGAVGACPITRSTAASAPPPSARTSRRSWAPRESAQAVESPVMNDVVASDMVGTRYPTCCHHIMSPSIIAMWVASLSHACACALTRHPALEIHHRLRQRGQPGTRTGAQGHGEGPCGVGDERGVHQQRARSRAGRGVLRASERVIDRRHLVC